MKALLITGTNPNAGQNELLTVLTAYWNQYYQADRLGSLHLSVPLDLERTWHTFSQLCHQKEWTLVIEELGFGSPIAAETTIADLAWDWKLSTVLVVPMQPGTIGQTVAHVALARQARCHLKGIVLYCAQPDAIDYQEAWASTELIQNLVQIPVLGLLPDWLKTMESDRLDQDKLVQIASALDLERLFPRLANSGVPVEN